MRKFFLSLVLLVVLSPGSLVGASYDPLSVSNNRIGVHILHPQELADAAKLVNSSGGDWGYVTIPMQSNDRDRLKWNAFFLRAAELHLIPIIRLAAYVDKDKWVAPNAYDLVDFANFLSEMPWPTENRYVILFNEPNHAKEWGGKVNPGEYAALLVQAHPIFKARSPDFFLISAGLDMSVPQSSTSMDALEFYRQMSRSVPDWGTAVEGVSFHAYPNPAFRASYDSTSRFGPQSYRYELATLKRLGINPKNWFITETGTLQTSNFYAPVLTKVWTEPNIVAITPFLLFAGAGDFMGFSLLDPAHQPTKNYQEISSLPKTAGSPLLNIETLAGLKANVANIPPAKQNYSPRTLGNILGGIRSMLFREPTIKINNTVVTIEIADNDTTRRRGLSGRDGLAENHGMLFIFPTARRHQFWMNEMKFSLDMIWIRDGKVVEISSNIPHPALTNNQPQYVTPSESADSILEVPAGYAAAQGIKLGDSVTLSR